MSNWKRSFGWVGHIVAPDDSKDSDEQCNLVAIPREAFDQLIKDREDDLIDRRISVRTLGVTDGDVELLAVGTYFSEGFEHYGTVFEAAQALRDGIPPDFHSDEIYRAAMREIYDVKLPKSKFMIGCNSEH